MFLSGNRWWLCLFLVNVEVGVTMLLPLNDFVDIMSRSGSDTMLLLLTVFLADTLESFVFFRFFPDFPDL